MPLQQIPKITQEQIRSKGVESLADRPNQMSVYGQGGLNARELKQKFDALSAFLAQKINDLIDAQGSDDAADFIKVPISEDYQTLGDFIRAFLNGGAAEDLIRVYDTLGAEEKTSLQSAVYEIFERLKSAEESIENTVSKDDFATASDGGIVKADPATEEDTQPVRIGEDGKLYTAPGEGESDFNELDNRPKYNGSAMTGDTDIPEVKTDEWDEKYAKPSGGIPKNDLSDSVQESLALADTALQSESDPTVPAWAKQPNKPSYSASEITDGQTTVSAEIAAINGKIPSSATSQNKLATASDVSSAVGTETTRATAKESDLQSQIDAIVSSTDVRDVVGTYSELLVYDTDTLGNNDIVKVLNDTTHSGARSYYRWIISGTSGAWNYIGSEAISYTKTEEDALLAGKQDAISDLATIRSGATNAVHYTAESKTAAEKSQARSNIGLNISAKTSEQTSEVGFDASTGKLYSVPGGGGSGEDANAVHYTAESKQPTQKAQARENIGAVGYTTVQPVETIPHGKDRMRLVGHYVIAPHEDVILITTDGDGNPFSLRRMYVKVTLPTRSGTYNLGSDVIISGGKLDANYPAVSTASWHVFNYSVYNGGQVIMTYYLEIDKDYEPVLSQAFVGTSGQQNANMNRIQYTWDPRGPISAFRISNVTDGFDAGTEIDIYGEDY